MFTLEMKGFDEIQRNLRRLADNAASIDGEHSIPATERCPAFMAEHTDFATIEEMVEASEFTVETAEDFGAIPHAERDAFIARRTRFADWRTMQEKAVADWFRRGVGLA